MRVLTAATAMGISFFLLWAPDRVRADDLYVPSEYSSIQEAIYAADEGDTVFVEAGTYFERIIFSGPPITVESVAGPSETTIDAGQQGPVVLFEESRSTLRGFTLINGLGATSPYIAGGGVVIFWGSPVIENCVISDNRGNQGGGIAAIGGGTIRRCKILRNVADTQGGGVYSLHFGDPLVLVNTVVAENHSNGHEHAGAGVDGLVELTNCSVLNNTGGYGIANAYGSSILNSIVYGNGGGQIESTSVSVSFSNVEGGQDGEGNMDQAPLFDEGSNYHLSENSPCIDNGVSVDGVTEDIDGEVRPFGEGFDIGSDEFVPSRDAEANVSLACFAVNRMMVVDKKRGARRDKIRLMGSLNFEPGSEPFASPPAVTARISYGDPVETISVTFPEESLVESYYPGIYLSRIQFDRFGRAILIANVNKCFWRVIIRGEEVSGIYNSEEMPIVELAFGGAVGTTTFDRWTWKWDWRRLGIAWFLQWPRLNCCAE